MNIIKLGIKPIASRSGITSNSSKVLVLGVQLGDCYNFEVLILLMLILYGRGKNSTMSVSSPHIAAQRQSPWQLWVSFLSAPIDGASLAVYRIVFGLTFAIYAACYFFIPDIHEQFAVPKFFFSFIPFIQPLPEFGMYAVYVCNFVAALLIALGLYYRAAAIAFLVGSTYVFLLDRTLFLNHEYLACLTALLMAIAPANNNFSLDRHFHPEKFPTCTIPRWNLLIIKCQIVIVYMYGAIWKINPDWLSGIPCQQFVTCNPGLRFFEPFAYHPLFPKFLAYGGIIVDSLEPIFLIIPQTFWLAVALAVPFHVMNGLLFDIGVFPFFMLGTLVLFPPHSWPRKWIGKNRAFHEVVGPAAQQAKEKATSLAQSAKSGVIAARQNATKQLAWLPPDVVRSGRLGTVAMLVFFHVYLLIQLVVPLRHLAYDGNVDWTEEGYYFAWRMMLHMKLSEIAMYTTDPRTGVRKRIRFDTCLNKRQYETLSRRPESAHHFAQWYANKYEEKFGVRPIITAKCIASLHCRPWQDLIDPRVDLAAQPFNLAHKNWIVPINSEIVDLPNYQQRDWFNAMANCGNISPEERAKLATTSVGLNAF